MSWTDLRVLTAQAVEAGAPVANDFVTMNDFAEYVEIRFTPLTLAGGPTAVTFAIWRQDEGQIDKVSTVEVTSAQAPAPLAVIVYYQGAKIHGRVDSFTGGAGQTVTGTLQFREIHL